MSTLQHTVSSPDGFTPAHLDRAILGVLPGIANAAGSAAGDAVTVAVSLPTSADLPSDYCVLVSPGQDATWFVTEKTSEGFSVTLSPRLAADTLAAGKFDVVLVA